MRNRESCFAVVSLALRHFSSFVQKFRTTFLNSSSQSPKSSREMKFNESTTFFFFFFLFFRARGGREDTRRTCIYVYYACGQLLRSRYNAKCVDSPSNGIGCVED